ncbi:MAG: hypothetical protein IJY46_00270 [Lentisphaeria bacterium]|nr:hypothetical protein [Lentisphaeria bacterium]
MAEKVNAASVQCGNFKVLFCTPSPGGVLECSGGEILFLLREFLQSLDGSEKNPAHAQSADYLNALRRLSKTGGFPRMLAQELFDAFAKMDVFPDNISSVSSDGDGRFLLDTALELCRFLRQLDIEKITVNAGRIFPECRELFRELPATEDELLKLLKECDPFSSGQVFCYRNRRFVPVEPVSVRKVSSFFGYPGVRAAYADHFRDFANGKTNLPLLINSLPGYGKTSMVISYALAEKNLIPVLAEPDVLEENWNPLISSLAQRKDHKFVLFFDDIDPAKVDWYSFRTNVGGAFAPPANVMPVLTANYEFPASILSRGRKISYPVFDELRCSEMIEDFLRSFGMQRPPDNLISLIGAEYTGEFGQKKFTELSPRTLIRHLKVYEHDQNKRRTMIELASGEMITRPDPELFYEFNINLMRTLYGEEYIQRLLKEKLREL